MTDMRERRVHLNSICQISCVGYLVGVVEVGRLAIFSLSRHMYKENKKCADASVGSGAR